MKIDHSGEKLDKLITSIGWSVEGLSKATYKFIDGGIDRRTIYRMIKNEVHPQNENIHAVMQALAEKIGHNDIEKIKEEIDFQVVTQDKKQPNKFQKNFSIQSIKVVENECLWENEIVEENDKKNIIGFSEKSKDVWIRWRKYPTPNGKDNHYDNTQWEKNVRIVFDILKRYLKNKSHTSNQNPYILAECNKNYSVISDSSFKLVFRKLIESFRGHNNFIECIKSIWPSKEELDFYSKSDIVSWEALTFFQKDFLRDRFPVFAIEIKNESNNPILIDRAAIEMKNLIIDMYPKDFAGGYTLEKIADYELTLTNLNNSEYLKFLEDSIKANPLGYKDIYKGRLGKSYLELDPKLIIKREGTVLIYIRVKGGYRWPCQIKFSFFDSRGKEQESKWYSFNVISHPSINLFEFEGKQSE